MLLGITASYPFRTVNALSSFTHFLLLQCCSVIQFTARPFSHVHFRSGNISSEWIFLISAMLFLCPLMFLRNTHPEGVRFA